MIANPLVSFVLPSYNYGRFIGDCLGGILGQRGTGDFEVIVVDDASTDDSVEVIQQFRDERIRLHRHETNLGHVVTINEGFALARGRFVARIDSDDRYTPHFLEESLAALGRAPQAGLVYGRVRLIDSAGTAAPGPPADEPAEGGDRVGDMFLPLLLKNFIPAPTVLARREAWQAALPIPAGLGFSDWYLSLGIAARFPVYFRDRVLADYRVHAGGLHSRMTRDKSEEATILRLLGEVFYRHRTDCRVARFKSRVYAAQYLTLADKYFGLRMNADARRCYTAAVRRAPRLLSDPGVLRRTVATYLGRELYDRAKRLLGDRK